MALRFELVSPERLLRAADVYMVVVPGTDGDFGVLARHAPFLSTIRPGAISVYAESMSSEPERIFIDGGFAEVNDKGLTILAEYALPVSDIDSAEVAQQLADARDDVRIAKNDVERALAEKRVARYAAMQAAATH